MEQDFGEEALRLPPTRGRHINKRALKNKALSVSFNEKELRDFVGGFHKRKKKRRKEAQKQQEEALRRKRIEEREKRKLEQALLLHGGDPLDLGSEPHENEESLRDNEEGAQDASVSGTTMYDNGDMKITVTTSEISREESSTFSKTGHGVLPGPAIAQPGNMHNLAVNKSKSFKKFMAPKHQPKPHGRRDQRKVSKRNKKSR